jgi:hypothetical protein
MLHYLNLNLDVGINAHEHIHIKFPINRETQGVTPNPSLLSIPRVKPVKSSICHFRLKYSLTFVLKNC